MTETRINARLDQAAARKLAILKRRTGLSTSEILRAALEQFHARTTRDEKSAKVILETSGFVGCAKGPVDLSSNYKRSISDSLRKKHA